MRTQLSFAIMLSLGVVACGDDNGTTTPDAPITKTYDAKLSVADAGGGIDAEQLPADVDVTADIAADTTWHAATTYHLKKKTTADFYIFVNPGATLTIEPGTKILGGAGSALVVARGGRLVADGTAAKPIVFSQDMPVGSRGPGGWGGIVILGAAPTNYPNNGEVIFEGFPATFTDPRAKFGGTNPADDSGILRYVRVEFGGVAFEGINKEFNGITLCGVGSGTIIDFVQSHNGADDGFEFFGGTVNVKHLVSSMNDDDGFDTDNGYNGKVQFLIVQHIKQSPQAADPNGYESDNCATCSDVAINQTPRTAPTVYNATIIGTKTTTAPAGYGAVLRRDTTGQYFNQIFFNFKTAGTLVSDAKTCAQIPANLGIQNSIFFQNAADNSNWLAADANCDEKVKIGDVATNLNVDPMLTDATNATAPNFKPMTGSPALTATNAAPTPTGDAFFTAAPYLGAIGTTDWTAGWTSYPAN